ncbi:hypothetical protein ACWEQ7_03960 [Streptomyces sp. NPDC004069]
MSAPLVVNTLDGTLWTRRAVTRDGMALYAPEGVCSCPEFVMATLAELAERGIAGSADALPVPVGPEAPQFPPPPRTELERLGLQVAELQETAAEFQRDATRARRERDLIRERVSEPFGCQHCGAAKRCHGRRYVGGAGMHAWERPTDEQVKDRMLARRAARMPLDADRAKAPWGRGKDGRPLLPMGAHWTDVPELVDRTVSGIQSRLDQAQSGHWYVASDTETWRAPGTVCTRVGGASRTVGQFSNVLPADLDLVLHAHSDLGWCLDMIAKLRAQVAELESSPLGWAEKLDAKSLDNFLIALSSATEYEPMDGAIARIHELLQSYREVDGITRRIVPVQVLREDEPAVAPPLMVYRAEHPDSGITLGRYGTEAAARAHCEATERRSWPTGTSLSFDWIEDEEDGVAELVVVAGQNEESTTGYMVTALELASAYDPDGDE